MPWTPGLLSVHVCLCPRSWLYDLPRQSMPEAQESSLMTVSQTHSGSHCTRDHIPGSGSMAALKVIAHRTSVLPPLWGAHKLDVVATGIPLAMLSPMGEKDIKWSPAAFATKTPRALTRYLQPLSLKIPAIFKQH